MISAEKWDVMISIIKDAVFLQNSLSQLSIISSRYTQSSHFVFPEIVEISHVNNRSISVVLSDGKISKERKRDIREVLRLYISSPDNATESPRSNVR